MSLEHEIKVLQQEQANNVHNLKQLLLDIYSIHNALNKKISKLNIPSPSTSNNLLEVLNIKPLHNKNFKGDNIKVAVIDNGFISIPNKLKYKQIYSPSENTKESYGHGTQVASVICGAEIGIAPNVELYACSIEKELSVTQLSSANKCIRWCIDNHMDIINMSFGYPNSLLDCSYEKEMNNLEKLCNEAYTKNITIVCSAGNDGNNPSVDTIKFPGNLDLALAIGSVNYNLDLSDFSGTGDSLDYVTIGEDIDVYDASGKIIKNSGTSFAAGVASGIIALLKQQKKDLSKDDIDDIFTLTSYDLGCEGKDKNYGKGYIKGCFIPDNYSHPDEPSTFLFEQLNISEVHKLGIKGKGVKIAIIGYGCSQLDDLNIYKYINLTNDKKTEWVSAMSPVGDICTSIIASKSIGIAPESEIYVLRDRNADGWFLKENYEKAMNWCLNNDIDIVFTDSDTPLEVLAKLNNKGIICVMPCSPQLETTSEEYQNNKYSLKVTFLTPENKYISYNENRNLVAYQGESVDCACYGYGFQYVDSTGILSTHTESQYPAAMWRTMFASYQAIGILALLKQQNPEINTAEKVRKILPELCDNLGQSKNNKTGYGLLQAKILN